MNVVDVRSLSTSFGGSPIHKEVTFGVRRGEIFAIAGASGCGKSTLLREILMLQNPSSGTIKLFGRELSKLDAQKADALRKRCGVLFQSSGLFSSLSVTDNIAVALRENDFYSEELVQSCVALKLAMVGLHPSVGTLFPSELSGGMKKRAALARALSLDPELLFLDEPTSGLDPQSARSFDALILQLKKLLGLTIVMVTHDLDSIERTVDRMIILADGRAVVEASPQEAKECPHPAVKSFFTRTLQKGDF